MDVNINSLKCAIIINDLNIVKKLLPRIDKYMTITDEGISVDLLRFALSKKSFEIFNYLATQIDVDYINEYGTTILSGLVNHSFLSDHIQNGDKYDTLKHVLGQSKNINKQFKDGETLLHIAVRNINLYYQPRVPENLENLEKLEDYKNRLAIIIEYGADPFIENYNRVSAIALLLYQVNPIELLTILLKTKINGYIKTYTFNEVIRRGDMSHLFDVIELILPLVEDINTLDSTGHSALWYAKNYIPKETDVIELLEESGAKTF